MNMLLREAKKELHKINMEKQAGLPHDYFMALVNISKEFCSKGRTEDEIVNIWRRNRLYIKHVNKINNTLAETSAFDEVLGKDNLFKFSGHGGVVFTYHFGYYRHVVLDIAKFMQSVKKNIELAIVVDSDSYNHENELMRNEHEKMGIKYIIAENPNSLIKVHKIIKNKGIVFVFIDGFTGHGKDSYEIRTNLISSTIQVRSGIFRLLEKMNKPYIPALSNCKRLEIYSPVFCNGGIENFVEQLYSNFRRNLMEHPHLWRFWFRHHKHVLKWETKVMEEKNKNLIWFNKFNQNKLYLEVKTGRVYKVGN